MTALELIMALLQAFAFIMFYTLVGFGPGFVIGILLANRFLAPGQPTYMESHNQGKKLAAQHNAQWAPSHERWQK